MRTLDFLLSNFYTLNTFNPVLATVLENQKKSILEYLTVSALSYSSYPLCKSGKQSLLNEVIHRVCNDTYPHLVLPTDGYIWDYFIDTKSVSFCSFTNYTTPCPQTVSAARSTYLSKLYILHNLPFVIVGKPLSGKSYLLKRIMEFSETEHIANTRMVKCKKYTTARDIINFILTSAKMATQPIIAESKPTKLATMIEDLTSLEFEKYDEVLCKLRPLFEQSYCFDNLRSRFLRIKPGSLIFSCLEEGDNCKFFKHSRKLIQYVSVLAVETPDDSSSITALTEHNLREALYSNTKKFNFISECLASIKAAVDEGHIPVTPFSCPKFNFKKILCAVENVCAFLNSQSESDYDQTSVCSVYLKLYSGYWNLLDPVGKEICLPDAGSEKFSCNILPLDVTSNLSKHVSFLVHNFTSHLHFVYSYEPILISTFKRLKNVNIEIPLLCGQGVDHISAAVWINVLQKSLLDCISNKRKVLFPVSAKLLNVNRDCYFIVESIVNKDFSFLFRILADKYKLPINAAIKAENGNDIFSTYEILHCNFAIAVLNYSPYKLDKISLPEYMIERNFISFEIPEMTLEMITTITGNFLSEHTRGYAEDEKQSAVLLASFLFKKIVQDLQANGEKCHFVPSIQSLKLVMDIFQSRYKTNIAKATTLSSTIEKLEKKMKSDSSTLQSESNDEARENLNLLNTRTKESEETLNLFQKQLLSEKRALNSQEEKLESEELKLKEMKIKLKDEKQKVIPALKSSKMSLKSSALTGFCRVSEIKVL